MSGGMFPSCHPHMGPGLHLQENNGGQEVETHTKEQAQGEWNPLLCYLCHQVHLCNLHCINCIFITMTLRPIATPACWPATTRSVPAVSKDGVWMASCHVPFAGESLSIWTY